MYKDFPSTGTGTVTARVRADLTSFIDNAIDPQVTGWFNPDPTKIANLVGNPSDSMMVYVGSPNESAFDTNRRWFSEVLDFTKPVQELFAYGDKLPVNNNGQAGQDTTLSLPYSGIMPVGGNVRVVFRVKTNRARADGVVSSSSGRRQHEGGRRGHRRRAGRRRQRRIYFDGAGDVTARSLIDADVGIAAAGGPWATTGRPPAAYWHIENIANLLYEDLCGSVGHPCAAATCSATWSWPGTSTTADKISIETRISGSRRPSTWRCARRLRARRTTRASTGGMAARPSIVARLRHLHGVHGPRPVRVLAVRRPVLRPRGCRAGVDEPCVAGRRGRSIRASCSIPIRSASGARAATRRITFRLARHSGRPGRLAQGDGRDDHPGLPLRRHEARRHPGHVLRQPARRASCAPRRTGSRAVDLEQVPGPVPGQRVIVPADNAAFDTTTAYVRSGLNTVVPVSGPGYVAGDSVLANAPYAGDGVTRACAWTSSSASIRARATTRSRAIAPRPSSRRIPRTRSGPPTCADNGAFGTGGSGASGPGHAGGVLEQGLWNSCRMDSAELNLWPVVGRSIGVPTSPTWLGTIHELDPKFAALGIGTTCLLPRPIRTARQPDEHRLRRRRLAPADRLQRDGGELDARLVNGSCARKTRRSFRTATCRRVLTSSTSSAARASRTPTSAMSCCSTRRIVFPQDPRRQHGLRRRALVELRRAA